MMRPPDTPGMARGEIASAPLVRTYRIEPVRSVVCILSPCITRVAVHFDDVRCRGCKVRNDGAPWCEGCAKRHVLKTQDWLTVLDPSHGRLIPQLMCLTPFATERPSPFPLWDYQGRLAPRMLWVWRYPARRDGPIYCQLVPNDNPEYDPPYVPDELPDTYSTLVKMWAAPLRPVPLPKPADVGRVKAVEYDE